MLILAVGCVKLSIIFFCRRIFLVSKRTMFGICSTLMIIISVCWTLAFFLLFLFGCGRHLAAHWGTLANLERVCGNGLALETSLVVTDLATDLMVWFLPLPMVRIFPPADRQLSTRNSIANPDRFGDCTPPLLENLPCLVFF